MPNPGNAADIDRLFADLTKSCWLYDNHEGPPPQLSISSMPLPSSGEYPRAAWEESCRRANALADGIPLPTSPLQSTIFMSMALESHPDVNAQSPPDEWLRHKTQINALSAFVACDDESADERTWINALETILIVFTERMTMQKDIKHPIAPLVRAMLHSTSRASLNPSPSRHGIIPNPLQGARALGYLPKPPESPDPTPGAQTQAMLPKFDAGQGSIVPTGMVYTYHAAGGPIRSRGRGAPLPKRLFYEVLSSLPQEGRSIQGRWELACTLRDLRDWLYPTRNGKPTKFVMNRHLNGIIAALHEVSNMRVRVTPAGDEAPTNWLPIAVRALPEPNLASRVLFDINLPPGSSGGALIDREMMRHYGLISAPRHSACLGLVYYWDKFGTKNGRRVLPTRPVIARDSRGVPIDQNGAPILTPKGLPVQGYNDARIVFLNDAGDRILLPTLAQTRAAAARERNPAIEFYPLLTDADLLLLCYPEDANTLPESSKRVYLHRAKKSLQSMQDDGYCVIDAERIRNGEERWRIAPAHPAPATD